MSGSAPALTAAAWMLLFGTAEALEPWRVVEAPMAGLRLEVPRSWRLHELELCDTGERPRTVVLVRLSSRDEQPPLSETADLEIYVHALEDEPPLVRRLQGEASLEGTLHREGGAPFDERFVIGDRRALRVTAPVRPGLELAVQHVLDTIDLAAARPARESTAAPAPTARSGTVRPLLLVPADVSPRADYRLVLIKTFRHLQAWFQQATGGVTYGLADGQILKSGRKASWFANNAAGSDPAYWFFRNGAAEAFALTGGRYDDPVNRWVVYVDADQGCGDSGGKGGQGVAVMPRNDLRGLTNQAYRPPCGEAPAPATPCRWIGGAGHELGHALGLRHPAGCEDKAEATVCPDALMWAGYAAYPRTALTSEDRERLGAGGLLAPIDGDRSVYDCGKLFAPPRAP